MSRKSATSARLNLPGKLSDCTNASSEGSDSYNMNLSQRRAESVRAYLISKGVAASRMTAKGYGETVPIADNATEDGRKQNRRVELVRNDQ